LGTQGRFYGGVWINRALQEVERSRLERLYATLSGVTL
jgi:hypothetical protein